MNTGIWQPSMQMRQRLCQLKRSFGKILWPEFRRVTSKMTWANRKRNSVLCTHPVSWAPAGPHWGRSLLCLLTLSGTSCRMVSAQPEDSPLVYLPGVAVAVALPAQNLPRAEKPPKFQWAAPTQCRRTAGLLLLQAGTSKTSKCLQSVMPEHSRISKKKMTLSESPGLLHGPSAGQRVSPRPDIVLPQAMLASRKPDLPSLEENVIEGLVHQLLSRVQAKVHTLMKCGDSPESMDASAASVVVSSASWHVGMPSLQTTLLDNGWSRGLQDTHSALGVRGS